MPNVSSVEELRSALSNKESDIVISDPTLSRKVAKLKGISGAAFGIAIVSAAFFAVNPLVGIATLGGTSVWFGREPLELFWGLGQENTRQLYFNYEVSSKDYNQYTLKRK